MLQQQTTLLKLPTLLHILSTCWIIICSIISASAENVQVLSLNADIWTPSMYDVYARFNLTENRSLEQFSVCYRLHPTAYTIVKQHLSYYNEQDDLSFYQYKQNLLGFFLGKSQKKVYQDVDVQLPINKWTHFCHVIDRGAYSLFVDGRLRIANVSLVLPDNKSLSLPLQGCLVLGQEQDSLSGGFDSTQTFQGYVAQMNIWSRPLGLEEAEDVALCKRNLVGDVLSTDSDTVPLDLNGGASVEERDLKSFCNIEDDYVIFPEEQKLKEVRTFCNQIGGQVYIPQSLDKSKLLYETALNFSDSSTNNYLLWLGATDEAVEGVWRTFDTGDPVKTFFPEGHQTGGSNQNCIYMHKTSGAWEDQSCNTLRESLTACENDPTKTLRLRGLCADADEKTYFQVLANYKNNKPIFHGYYGYIIYYNGNSTWHLYDTQISSVIAETRLSSGKVYPIGRQTWISRLEFHTSKKTQYNYGRQTMCDVPLGSPMTLSLSACTEDEYMCQSGDCVLRDANCDLQDDCRDLSDEDNCYVVKIPSYYRKNKSPKGSNNNLPLVVQPKISIKRIANVEDINEAVTMELTITQIWNDSRLTFTNILDEKSLNELSQSEADGIWHPHIIFGNDINKQVRLEVQTLQVDKIGPALPPDYNDVYMDMTYNGSAGQLYKSELYDGTFYCKLDVFFYPFDVQWCTVVIESDVEKRLVVFGEPSVDYLGSSVLSSYVISDVTATKITSDSLFDLFQVEFILSRRYSRIILVVFVPSSMILCIGISTLFIKMSLQQVRLVVALTTLLVLYTLSVQVSASLPTTAYIKMIDIWFFFCICLLFCIILLHIFIEYCDRDIKTRDKIATSPEMTYMVPAPKLSEVIISKMRTVIVPIIVIAFNIIFWSIMLT